MPTRRFRSKIDNWLLMLGAVSVIAQVVSLAVFLRFEPPSAERLLIVVLMTLVMLLILSLFVRTHYTVTPDELRIASGPFTWRIRRSEIHSIEPSRALWSSPALSLDRLRIAYGDGKWILVSPDDKRGFLRALGHEEA